MFIRLLQTKTDHAAALPQGDEFLTSMASTHSSAKTFETFEQAQNAIELVTTAYRTYMDKLYEVYPQVSSDWMTPPPHPTRPPFLCSSAATPTCPLQRVVHVA